LASEPKYKEAFIAMLKEGIPEKRKYCTPLEALLWILYDKEPDDPTLKNIISNPIELVEYAWRYSSESKNYASERWKNFDEVVDRLNSPGLVHTWVKSNLVYDYSLLKKNYIPETTFKLKRGVCRHAATLTTEFLSRGGYDVKSLTVTWEIDEGHTVTILKNIDGFHIVMDFSRSYYPGEIKGPFKDYQDIAKYIVKNRTITWMGVETNEELMRRIERAYGTSPE
jgi:hypothetical protein